jgi:hypothetical protein
MRPPRTLAGSVARYRGPGRAARCCGLARTLYNLTWAEQEETEETEETTETEETEEMSISCF